MQSLKRRSASLHNNLSAISEDKISTVFVESVDQVGRKSWDALCASRQYCRYDYMQALESSGLDCRFLYAVALDDSAVIAVALATLWRIPLLGGLGVRVLTTGSPVNTGSPLIVAAGIDPEQVAEPLLRAMEAKAAELGVHLFVGRDLPTADFANLPRLERLYACAYLELVWSDFERYLVSRRKSKSIRRDMRAIEKAGYVLEVRKGRRLSEDEAERLQQLWLQLYHKHRSPDQILITKAFFQRMSELDHAIWLLLLKDGHIQAFDLCFALGDTLESTYCGVDLVSSGRLAVHRVMGYEIVRYAIQEGFRTVNFGISNEQSKVEGGCRLRVQYAWVEAYPKWLGGILRPIALKAILHDCATNASDQDDAA
ncbi:GNAT family N-acetyltransferase [Pseudomonas aeruginosa]|nr:GNAT family N-acetyltransferase [Pseudomonas aeruginosa]